MTPSYIVVRITSDLDSIQLQKDIDNFLEWSQLWLLNTNKNKCKGMRIAISDRSHLIYMLDGEQLNVASHQKILASWWTINLNFISTLHLLLPRQIGFWVSIVSPLNALTLIPYLDFTKLWYAQLLNLVSLLIGDQRLLEKVQKHAI